MNERIKNIALESGVSIQSTKTTNDETKEVTFNSTSYHFHSEESFNIFTKNLLEQAILVVQSAKPGVTQIPSEVALDLVSNNIRGYFDLPQNTKKRKKSY